MLAAVCTRPVVTIPATARVRDAARLMRQKRVGALVVASHRRPKGIITDRDIAVTVVAEGRDPAELPVGDVMRWKPAVIREDDGILDALRLFDAEAVRRLPVVDDDGDLVGIITLDDVLMLLGSELGQVAAALARSLGHHGQKTAPAVIARQRAGAAAPVGHAVLSSVSLCPARLSARSPAPVWHRA